MTAEPTPSVCVIVPTLARAARAALLRRALESVLGQAGVRAVPVVVVNGSERDPELVAELAARRDLRRIELAEADLPAALRAGRAAVDTPWFAELDDDDILLPGTLARRLARASEDTGCAAVLCNGIVRDERGDRPLLRDVAAVARDPLGALGAGTWLSPGSGLFRSDALPVDVFEGMPHFLEWTYLALRLARDGRLCFLDEPGFVYHAGRPDSLWHSRECVRQLPASIGRLLALELPASLRRTFEERLTDALHGCAREALERGDRRAAWSAHLRALGGRRGWHHLPFTARLLARSLAPAPR